MSPTPTNPAEVRQLPIITVNVCDLNIYVRGKTGPRSHALGFSGLGFRWDGEQKRWKGKLSLANLQKLAAWPEVRLNHAARVALEEMEQAAKRRADYLQERAQKVQA